jgi:hypothetical protein
MSFLDMLFDLNREFESQDCAQFRFLNIIEQNLS